ncbi:amidohydrolase family protein [Paenibacillus koleovorans]|uniref:amidohydrolase family protein n=1 Tax=Paenibacillus koleovorans TaxID=121608 RepID=UPI000FD71C62|nr:amidohydrolase family protein [Paenibacillus koleovorans]
MRVDAHQHYWKPERADYGWLTPATGLLYADYLPAHLKPYLRRFGIDKTIVVQAAPTVAETEFMLRLADEDETIAGVVGWLDLESEPDAFLAEFLRLKQHPRFVGIRPMIQNLPTEWILQEQVLQNLRTLVKYDFPIDLQARPRHLGVLIELFERVPGLRAVIDHLAKPEVTLQKLESWRTEITSLARCETVLCKLSGMVPEVLDGVWGVDDYLPYVETIFEVFGTERVMFGSDWPVCLLSATYEDVWKLLELNLPPGLTARDRRLLYGENAARFYGILFS